MYIYIKTGFSSLMSTTGHSLYESANASKEIEIFAPPTWGSTTWVEQVFSNLPEPDSKVKTPLVISTLYF